MQEKLVKKELLEEADFAEISKLAKICEEYEGFSLKLNWDMMHYREVGSISDFFYYQAEKLVAYLPLDGFGDKFELTGMVLPEYRRKGIGSQLLAEALSEAKKRKASQLLLVNYRASQSGTAFAKAKDFKYQSSEYRMEAKAASMPTLAPAQIKLIQVNLEDIAELSRLLGASFGGGDWASVDELEKTWREASSRYFFARLGNENIGQIGVIEDAGGMYIRGVGIVPERQGKGYGRQLLAATLRKLLDEGHTLFRLDVETQNENALSLYTSCGFVQTNVYDYYNVPL